MAFVFPSQRSLSLVVCLLLSMLSAPLIPRAAQGAGISLKPRDGSVETLTIDVPAVRWERAAGGFAPRIDGFGATDRSGYPQLPLRRERLALPRTGSLRILDVRVEWSEGRLPGRLAAYPAHDAEARLSQEALALKDAYWPRRAVEVVSRSGAFRSLAFATLEITPLQVEPGGSRFRVARRIVVTLDRDVHQGPATADSATGDDPLFEAVGSTLALGTREVPRSLGPSPAEPSTTAETPPSYPAWQLEVESEGLYRVSYEWASSNYPDLLQFLTSHDPRRYLMRSQGVDVPIQVVGEADGSFDPGDEIRFYGEPVEADILDPDVWQGGDFADANVYRIELADGPARIEELSGAPQGAPTPDSFEWTARTEPNVRFQGFVPEDGVDHWYDYPWINTLADDDSADLFVDTPDHVGGEVKLRLRLMGFDYANNLHRSEVLVDDQLVDGCGDGDNGCVDWDGHREFTHGVDQGAVTFDTTLAGSTKVTVNAPLGRGVNRDQFAVNWVELDYQRGYRASNGRLLFTAENTSREIRLEGFTSLPEIWDVSRTSATEAGDELVVPRRITGAELSGSDVLFGVEKDDAVSGARRFASVEDAGWRVPSGVREDRPPSATDPALGDSLKSTSIGADWIVVGHRSVLFDTGASSLGPELTALRNLREDPAGQGLATAVIDVQDIYDEFSYGIEDPGALREFFDYVLGGGAGPCTPRWDPAPSFALLTGDASWDYQNHYGYTPASNLVPTYMSDLTENTQFGHYPSDVWFGTVCGDDELADVSIGRLPVHSYTEAEDVFRKIHTYEGTDEPGSVTGRALLVSEYEGGTNGPFFRVHDEIHDQWFADGPASSEKIYEPNPDTHPEGGNGAADEQNQHIDDAVNAGAGVISFAGHGAYQNWGKTFSFFATEPPGSADKDDLEDIAAGTPYLFTVQANCITGNFAAISSKQSSSDLSYAFAEDWLATADKGIVAGLAPMHLTGGFQLDQILDPVYEEMFGRRKTRLVAAIDSRLRSEFDSGNQLVDLRSFALLGDPATRLAIPAPEPPAITSVDNEGSRALRIDWTVSEDPEAQYYRIYRARSALGPYSLAGETADASTTTFLDSGLENCQDYYYYLVSVDAEGFEGAWSNYNTDCDVSGPDCKTGTPEDPDPPRSPTLLEVNDTQRGGQLEVIWEPVSDPNGEIVRYHIRYGTTSGSYDSEKTEPPGASSTVLLGLENNTRYYVVVESAHCSQRSAPSNELSGVPHEVKGINSPESIQDLTVSKQGPDLLLEWTLPDQTVWGVDTSVSSVEVHGDSAQPDFPVDGSRQLADLPGSAVSWAHAGQNGGGASRWFYIVMAKDGDGLASAAGAERPAAIEDLRLSKLDSSTLELVWTRVATSFGDHRIWIAGYNLYGRDGILERAEIGASDLLQGGIPDTGSFPGDPQRSATTPTPAPDFYTFHVLAEGAHGQESVW